MTMWLDDIREPWAYGYIAARWVKTAAEAIAMLRTGEVTFASLDHDLAAEHYPWNCTDITKCQHTGYDVVVFLEENPQFWPKEGVAVHSANPVGRQRMEVVVQRHYGKNF